MEYLLQMETDKGCEQDAHKGGHPSIGKAALHTSFENVAKFEESSNPSETTWLSKRTSSSRP